MRLAICEVLETRQYLTAVQSVTLNYDVPQKLVVTFDGPLAQAPTTNDLYLENLWWGEQVSPNDMAVTWNGTNTATYSFPGLAALGMEIDQPAHSLRNGIYQWSIGPNLFGADGNALPTRSDTLPMLMGDATRDGVVNVTDQKRVYDHYGSANPGWAEGDFDGNHVVDALDLDVVDYFYATSLSALPDQPNEVAATASSGRGRIRLRWTIPETGQVDGFRIYRSTDGLHFNRVRDQTIEWGNGWFDTTVEEGTKYYYRVRAYVVTSGQEGGTGQPDVREYPSTNVVAITTNLPGPVNVSVTDVTSNSAVLKWADNSANESGFKVYTQLDGSSTWDLVETLDPSVGLGERSIRVDGLSPVTKYRARVVTFTPRR